MTATSVSVWLLAKRSGDVITAHCTCMAGCGESCSHVGAVLFAIETGVRLRDTATCTEQLSTWLPPHMKSVSYCRVKDIDFTSATGKKERLNRVIQKAVGCAAAEAEGGFTEGDVVGVLAPGCKSSKKAQCHSMKHSKIDEATEAELAGLYQQLAMGNVRSSILSLLPEFSDPYVPRKPDSPANLTNMHSEAAAATSWEELLIHCDAVFSSLVVTSEEAVIIEKATKDQAGSISWFEAMVCLQSWPCHCITHEECL
jgi:hypothetical protein